MTVMSGGRKTELDQIGGPSQTEEYAASIRQQVRRCVKFLHASLVQNHNSARENNENE